MKAVKL